MPTFYFDVYDGQRASRDETGADLESVEEAFDQAAVLLPEFARDVLPSGQAHDFAASVKDDAGNVIYRAMLLFRGQKVSATERAYVVPVAGLDYHVARRSALREQTRALGERLSDNIARLFSTIEEVRANVEALRRARGAGQGS